ncbi:MAG TPA: alpha/beta hydrolase [Candidatus Aquilonibacter sp.]
MHLFFRALLAAVLLTPGITPSQTFTTGILQVDHYGTNARPPIIFVPALYCGAWQWNAQIKALAPRYDLYVVTLPGFAGRPRAVGGDLMMRAVNSLHTIIAQHHLAGKVIVVGHSLGGTISVMLAQTYPHDPRAVISVEGGYPVAPTAEGRERAVARATKPFIDLGQSQLGPVLRKTQLQFVITRPADIDAVEKLASQSDPQAIVDWLRAALLLDLTPGMSKIVVPFTAIVPYDESIDAYRGFPTEASKRATYAAWVAHTRSGRVIVIAPSRHFVMFDQPAVFQETLEQVLARDLQGSK